jgi:hypothetical protein
MFVCALIALWGFWPFVTRVFPFLSLKRDVPLLEAATQAYEKTRNDPIGKSVRILCHDDNEEIIKWYCYALVGRRGHNKLVTLYGTRPPSRQRETIDIDSPLADFSIENGAVILRDRTERSAVVGQGLVVTSSDLNKAIAKIRSIGV